MLVCFLIVYVSILQLMTTLTTKLPSYQFLAVFAQIISRICHPNAEVFAKLEVNYMCSTH